jgi:uroporphyrinogen decarboxylase
MTNREILLSAIRLQKTPRNPVIILSSGVWTFYRFGLSLQDVFTKSPETVSDLIIKNYRELNVDLIWTAADCNNIVLKALGAKTTFDIAGSASTVDEPLIETVADIESLDINKIESSPDIQNLLAVTRLLKEKAAGEYLIGVSQWGPFTLAGQMIGIWNLMRLAVKDQLSVNALLDFCEKVILKYMSLFRQSGAELVCISDPSASGDMISKKLFETVAFPHLRSLYARIYADAKMLHICGNTSKILDLIPLTGADLFSFDQKVGISEAAAALGGKIAFAGQIDPVSVMLEGTSDEVLHTARECIKSSNNINGYILMPGCDLPPKTGIENVLSMVKAVH